MLDYKSFVCWKAYTHAEVAANISTFLALVMRARAREKSAEKITISPRRRLLDCTKYCTSTEHIGRTDATTVVRVLRAAFKTDSL